MASSLPRTVVLIFFNPLTHFNHLFDTFLYFVSGVILRSGDKVVHKIKKITLIGLYNSDGGRQVINKEAGKHSLEISNREENNQGLGGGGLELQAAE